MNDKELLDRFSLNFNIALVCDSHDVISYSDILDGKSQDGHYLKNV